MAEAPSTRGNSRAEPQAQITTLTEREPARRRTVQEECSQGTPSEEAFWEEGLPRLEVTFVLE